MSVRILAFVLASVLASTVTSAQTAPAKPVPAKAPSAAAKPGQTSPGAGPVIVVETEKGTFEFETYPNEAPKTVAHIINLVNKRYYNGQRVHRVVPGFVIQMGDQATRDMVSVIRDSGDALMTILNDVLDLSKIEAGRLVVSPTDTGLAAGAPPVRHICEREGRQPDALGRHHLLAPPAL